MESIVPSVAGSVRGGMTAHRRKTAQLQFGQNGYNEAVDGRTRDDPTWFAQGYSATATVSRNDWLVLIYTDFNANHGVLAVATIGRVSALRSFKGRHSNYCKTFCTP